MSGEKRQRLGLFGGSFNPVHLGHLIVAQDALEAFALDRVVFIPACQAPHKTGAAAPEPEHRLRMIEAAIADCPPFEVSDAEIRRAGVSFTVDTLRQFRNERPEADLCWIVGGDSLLELHTWKDLETILSLCQVVTVLRPGFARDRLTAASLRLPKATAERLLAQVVTGHLIDISSTEIRQRVARGQSLRFLVPEAVARYIAARQLYSAQENTP